LAAVDMGNSLETSVAGLWAVFDWMPRR